MDKNLLVRQLSSIVFEVSASYFDLPNCLETFCFVLAFMKSHTVGRQEDAHEFLRYFIDAMQTAALYPYKDQK